MKNQPTNNVPITWSYWVVPGRFLAGCHPAAGFGGDPISNMQGLLEHGIRHLINLASPPSATETYEQELRKMAAEQGVEIIFDRKHIVNYSVPTREGMIEILDRIDECVESNKPVYVHCIGGLGRTGTVVGCYLARHGIATGLEALARLQELRKNTDNFFMESPETSEQVDMLLEWREGE